MVVIFFWSLRVDFNWNFLNRVGLQPICPVNYLNSYFFCNFSLLLQMELKKTPDQSLKVSKLTVQQQSNVKLNFSCIFTDVYLKFAFSYIFQCRIHVQNKTIFAYFNVNTGSKKNEFVFVNSSFELYINPAYDLNRKILIYAVTYLKSAQITIGVFSALEFE